MDNVQNKTNGMCDVPAVERSDASVEQRHLGNIRTEIFLYTSLYI
jgi:hypothetical protein